MSQELTKEELLAIFQASFDGVFVTDGTGRTLWVNEAYERLSGFRRENLIGRPIQELQREGYISQSVIPVVLAEKQRSTIINSNRNGKNLLVTGVPVLDESGEVWRVVCNVRDITELVELHAELERKTELAHHYAVKLEELRSEEGDLHQNIVARSQAMRRVVSTTLRAANSDSTVMILGESGVGKELLAELIHVSSPRRTKPLIKVNCAAVPDSLMESEFFGYEKGSFTGALQQGKPGYFELAHEGTLFLDEVGELSHHVQAKLLRVIQEGEVIRLGATKGRKVDVRLVAATNRDLAHLVEKGTFRSDLFYRLNVIPITVPPLRERPDDIPALAHHLLTRIRRRTGIEKHLSREVLDRFLWHPWPGNVREMKNVLERMSIMTEGREIALTDLPGEMRLQTRPLSVSPPAPPAPGVAKAPAVTLPLRDALEEYERSVIREALSQHGGVRAAAKALGVPHSTLVRRIRLLGLNIRSDSVSVASP